MKILFMGTPEFAKECLRAIYESGEEIDTSASLGKGTYKMTAYLPTSDGLAQSYVYLAIK